MRQKKVSLDQCIRWKSFLRVIVIIVCFGAYLDKDVTADCGHCQGGDNVLYYPCDGWGVPCYAQPLTCILEWLPAGYYQGGSCVTDYVSIYPCTNDTYTGPTTSRRGTCQSDCSCIVWGPPYEDHIIGAAVCINLTTSCY